MTFISDEEMREMLTRSKHYTLVLLKRTAALEEPGAGAIVREHGRRNLGLRADGLLPIICRITDDSQWAGVGVFAASPEEVTRIMDGDPGVQAGLFTYEAHPVSSFPGDHLPG